MKAPGSGGANGFAVLAAPALIRGEPLGRPLAAREVAMLAAYARIGDQRQTAAALGISPNTARHLLERAYGKLGVTGAIDAFRVLGWLHVPEVAA